jgi:hypothetical protein
MYTLMRAPFCRFNFLIKSTSILDVPYDVDRVHLILEVLANITIGDMQAPFALTRKDFDLAASPTSKRKTEGSLPGEDGLPMQSPVIFGVFPETVPFGAGVSITLTGKYLSMINGMTITDRYGSVMIVDELVYKPSRSFASLLGTIIVPLPAMNSSGYHLIEVTTTIAGGLSCHSTIFISSPTKKQECALQGEWEWDEEAQVCLACPFSGYCPGGGRIWPIAGCKHTHTHRSSLLPSSHGAIIPRIHNRTPTRPLATADRITCCRYWSPDEFSMPTKCPAGDDACPGVPRSAKYQAKANFTESSAAVGAIHMATNACNVGYDGSCCSTCSEGYYIFDHTLCLACGERADTMTSLAVVLVFFVLSLFTAAILLLPSSSLPLLVDATLLLQQFSTLGNFAARALSPFPALLDFFSFVVQCLPMSVALTSCFIF